MNAKHGHSVYTAKNNDLDLIHLHTVSTQNTYKTFAFKGSLKNDLNVGCYN